MRRNRSQLYHNTWCERNDMIGLHSNSGKRNTPAVDTDALAEVDVEISERDKAREASEVEEIHTVTVYLRSRCF